MKGLIVYSSRTGNTERVARAVLEAAPPETDLYPVREAPNPDTYAWVFVAFWVDRGTADEDTRTFLAGLKGKVVGLFGTLGAYPDSEHARDVETAVRESIDSDNRVLGCYLCQGRIDPKLTEMFKRFPPDHPHAWTPERAQRHADAASHPDEDDLCAARETAQRFIAAVPETIGT